MKTLIWLMVLGTQLSFAQNVIRHKVEKGETVTQIAKKYNVAPKDIYKLNPDAQKGVPENTLLVIELPNKAKAATETKKKAEAVTVVTHEV